MSILKRLIIFTFNSTFTPESSEFTCSGRTVQLLSERNYRPSWIIRGVGGVTSDLHLTGLRPTENPPRVSFSTFFAVKESG